MVVVLMYVVHTGTAVIAIDVLRAWCPLLKEDAKEMVEFLKVCELDLEFSVLPSQHSPSSDLPLQQDHAPSPAGGVPAVRLCPVCGRERPLPPAPPPPLPGESSW